MRKYLLTCLITSIFISAASGQIVNIEDRRTAFDSSGWYGQLNLGGNYTRNANTVLSLHGSLRLDRSTDHDGKLLFLADYRMVRAAGSNFLNAGFGHLRYGRPLGGRWKWEIFTQLQYDEKIRLNMRWLVGTGPRINLLEGPAGQVFFGLMYMYEYDELHNVEITFRDHRISSYLSLGWNISEQARISNITYYQPRLWGLDKSRLSSSTAIVLMVTKKIGFTSQLSMTYDARINNIFPEIPSLTLNWVNGLRWKF